MLGAALGLGMTWFLLSKGVTSIGLGKKIEIFDVPWGTVITLAAVGAGIALLGSVYPLLRIRDTKSNEILRGADKTHVEPNARSFRRFTAVLMVVILPAAYFTVVPVVGELRAALLGTLLLGLGTMTLLIGLPLLVPEALVRVTSIIAAPFRRKWPLAGMMAAKSMKETPARIAVATVGIAMVTAGFVSLKGMTRSLRGEVENWATASVDDKVFIRDIQDMPFADLAAGLKKCPEVVGIERADARTYVPFLIVGVDPDELVGYGPCANDVNVIDAMRRGDGIILTGRLARDRGYTVGSSVLVPASSGKVQEFKVCAIAEDYGYFPQPDERMYGVVAESALHRHFCIDLKRVARVAVRFKTGTNLPPAIAALKRVADESFSGTIDWKYESGAAIRKRRTDDIDYDFRLFDIIIGLTALLAGLGVLNGQLLAAVERVKEYGILKALGASPGQIAGMALLENTVVGAVGGAIGCGLGAVLTPIVVRAVAEISAFDVPQRSAGELFFVGFGGAVFVAIVAGLYPVRRMNALAAADALRTGG